MPPIVERVRRLMLRRGKSPDEADDLAQEAMLRLEHYRQHHDVREPEAFAVRAAVNIAVDAERRARRSPLIPFGPAALRITDDSPDACEIVAARLRLRRLSAGLGEMKPRTRRILLARRLDERSCHDIARDEGISVSAVEKHIARGIAFLMDWMADS